LVEPFEGAGAALTADEDIDLKFLGVHIGMIAPGVWNSLGSDFGEGLLRELKPEESCLYQFFIFQLLGTDFDTSRIPSAASTAFIESRSSWLSVACVKTTSVRK